MIEPTPGRVVWYYPERDTCPGEYPGEGVPLAATIAFVHTPSVVNLTVHEKSGRTIAMEKVVLNHDDEPIVGCASWMPYQKAQSLKHAGEDAAKVDGGPGAAGGNPLAQPQTEPPAV